LQNGVTALLLAAAFGHTAIVDALLAAGADVNVQNEVCTSPHPALTSRIVSAVGAGVLRRGESPRRRPQGVTDCSGGVCVCAGEARWWWRLAGGTRLTRRPLTG
jgi:hypothetical protein